MSTSNDAQAALATVRWIRQLQNQINDNKYSLNMFYSSLASLGISAQRAEGKYPYVFCHDNTREGHGTEEEMLISIYEYLLAMEQQAEHERKLIYTNSKYKNRG